MKIHVSENLFEWSEYKSSMHLQDREWKTSYKYLNHAQSLLVIADDSHYYIDVISNLKRSIDHRIKLLSRYYDIKKVSKLLNIKGSLDTLAELQLVRRLMVNKIIELRNSIEHQFKEAPPYERCEEYIEFVWYFLRSTDNWVREVASDINFESTNSPHHYVELELNIMDGWNVKFRGCLPHDYFSLDEQANFYPLEVDEIKFGRDFKCKLKAHPEMNSDKHWDGLSDEDIFIRSTYVQSPNFKQRIIKEFFMKI